jgi:hypothetical protein
MFLNIKKLRNFFLKNKKNFKKKNNFEFQKKITLWKFFKKIKKNKKNFKKITFGENFNKNKNKILKNNFVKVF